MSTLGRRDRDKVESRWTRALVDLTDFHVHDSEGNAAKYNISVFTSSSCTTASIATVQYISMSSSSSSSSSSIYATSYVLASIFNCQIIVATGNYAQGGALRTLHESGSPPTQFCAPRRTRCPGPCFRPTLPLPRCHRRLVT